jgi:hypothetical protein
MDLTVGVIPDDPVHEIQELPASPPVVVADTNLTGGHIQSREQRGGAVSLVAMAETGQCFPIG